MRLNDMFTIMEAARLGIDIKDTDRRAQFIGRNEHRPIRYHTDEAGLFAFCRDPLNQGKFSRCRVCSKNAHQICLAIRHIDKTAAGNRHDTACPAIISEGIRQGWHNLEGG